MEEEPCDSQSSVMFISSRVSDTTRNSTASIVAAEWSINRLHHVIPSPVVARCAGSPMIPTARCRYLVAYPARAVGNRNSPALGE